MIVLQINYCNRSVLDHCYPGGDLPLLENLSRIAHDYVARLVAVYPHYLKSVSVSSYYFERPLRRFTPATSFGNLSSCRVPDEVRATAIVIQRDIALAIARWEAVAFSVIPPPPVAPPVVARQLVVPPTPAIAPQHDEFREIYHPLDTYYEEREHEDCS